jgi:hypothetical protein
MEALGDQGWTAIVILLSVSAVLAGSLCAQRSWWGRWTFPALVILGSVIAFILLTRLPRPGVDVLMFQSKSCDLFLSGSNPYAARFADPYPPATSANIYGPGVSVNGILQTGYPYMPLSLLMALPGHVLGDIRFANLAYLVLAALLIALARRRQADEVIGTLLLFSPIAPLILVLGWTEIHAVFLLALTWFCAVRRPRLLPYAFGLLVVSKQYMLAAAPLGLMLLPRPWRGRQVWEFARRAAIPAALTTLPFALWNLPEFLNSVVMFQVRQPFRKDALSYLNLFAIPDPIVWTWVPFAALGVMVALALLAGRRGRLTFFLGVSLCLMVFFVLSKQAFSNYYFVVITSMCVAAAASEDARAA